MSFEPIRYCMYPLVRREELEPGTHQAKMVRPNWVIEVIPGGNLRPGETWNLDLSSAILSLSLPPIIVKGERQEGGIDSIFVTDHKPQNGIGYQIPIGMLSTICIDPVDKVFWVE